MFLPVGKTADDLTLKDISASEDFVNSSIQFMTTGGANAKTTFNGKTVTAKYVYWPATDLPEDGEGWYLATDGDATVNQNSVKIPMGTGFLVSRTVLETTASLIYSGEVNASPVTLNFASSGYNVVGNCLPADLSIGDITVSEDFVNSSIQFMTSGGANAKVEFNGKQVYAKYVYWPESDKPEQGAGWYLAADGDATINQNELVTIPAGAGFLVSRTVGEPNVTLTLPSAL